jgi:hypothetical protein
MMEETKTSETLVNFYQTTRRYNPEDSHQQMASFRISIYMQQSLKIQICNGKKTEELF